ncbi:hypothetical protein B0T19DRAFT_129950 [Cercophora scortea]|uniref:Uncharacterized protein n=1 Tax=Cercophora scortea TaxID=314031 RepID=A0AAE0IZU5_9PEZI|nr:hypothetical protein B0T19DRAFT_129950 [Cercophora scortea]
MVSMQYEFGRANQQAVVDLFQSWGAASHAPTVDFMTQSGRPARPLATTSGKLATWWRTGANVSRIRGVGTWQSVSWGDEPNPPNPAIPTKLSVFTQHSPARAPQSPILLGPLMIARQARIDQGYLTRAGPRVNPYRKMMAARYNPATLLLVFSVVSVPFAITIHQQSALPWFLTVPRSLPLR